MDSCLTVNAWCDRGLTGIIEGNYVDLAHLLNFTYEKTFHGYIILLYICIEKERERVKNMFSLC